MAKISADEYFLCVGYKDFYLAAVIISMEMFSIQCQGRKENTKRYHEKKTQNYNSSGRTQITFVFGVWGFSV